MDNFEIICLQLIEEIHHAPCCRSLDIMEQNDTAALAFELSYGSADQPIRIWRIRVIGDDIHGKDRQIPLGRILSQAL